MPQVKCKTLKKKKAKGQTTNLSFSFLWKITEIVYLWIFKKLFYFILEYNWLTVLYFQVHSKGTHSYIYISIPSQTPLPSRLPYNIEQSSLCYAVGLCLLYILNIAVRKKK